MGLVAGVVILLGFAAWRLSEGPIPLNFLTPKLVQAFADGGTKVTIAQTLLVWDDQRQSLDLRVRDLTLQDDDGTPALTLPESNLTLDIGALFRGDIVVSALKVLGADLRVTRLEDGSFVGLGEGAPSSEPQPEAAPALALIDRLLADDESGPLAGLQGIGLVDSTIVFDDRATGRMWTLPASRIELRREARGLSGEADLAVTLEGETAYVQVVFAYGKRRGLLDLSANVQDLATTKLSAALPDLAPLSLLDSRVSGQVNVTLARDADLGLIDFDLTLGPGSLWLGGEGEPAISITGGSLAGLYDSAADTLELDRLVLRSGAATAAGPTATLSGKIDRDEHGRFADLTLAIDRIDAATLPRYWPKAMVPGGRAWVAENVAAGAVTALEVKTRLRFAPGTHRPSVMAQDLAGSFSFEGLSLAYLQPMPPVIDIAGTGTLSLAGLEFHGTQGHVGAITFAPIEVSIYGLDGEDHRLRVATSGAGPVPELFALLDHPRLALLTELGLPVAGATGQAQLSLNFDFSLRGELPFSAITTTVAATFQDLVLPKIWQGEDLLARELTLALNNELLAVRGDVTLGGSLFAAEWSEPLRGGERRIAARSKSVTAATLVRLLPWLEGRLGGEVALDLELRGSPSGKGSVTVDADLTAASLSVSDLDLQKAAGEAAHAAFVLRLEQGKATRLERLAVDAPGLAAEGTIQLAGGTLSRAELTRFVGFGQTLETVTAAPLEGGGWSLVLDGGTLDARPYLDSLENAGGESTAETPLRIGTSRLDRVILTKGSLENVAFAAQRDATGAIQLALDGRLVTEGAAASRLSLSLQPDAEGRRALKLDTDDMGALFRALDILDKIVGGSLTIEAHAAGSEPGSRMTGTVEGRSFRVLDAPTLGDMLGFSDALDSKGVAFERLTGEIAFQDGVLSTPLLRAYGSELGVTAKGSLDFGRDVIAIEGTMVPTYAVSQVLDNIPLIGWLITGGEDHGLLAVTYSVSGSVSNPKVDANALSALTPGFLRGLFDLFEDDGTTPPPTLYPDGPMR